jgi:hypothetical protein
VNRQRLKLVVALYSLLAVVGSSFSANSGAQVALEPAAFSALVAQALREKLDSAVEVSTEAPLVLQVQVAGRSISLPFDAVYSKCVAYSGFCRDSVRLYVDAAVETLAGAPVKPSAAQLRVLVRHREFVEQLARSSQASGPAAPVAQPFVGDLWIVLALAGKQIHWLVPPVMLADLNLDQSTAFELALKNTRAALPPLSRVARPLGSSGFSHVHGKFYASRLLLREDWRALAAGKRGEVLAILPDGENIIFGVVRTARELGHFKDIATGTARDSGATRAPTIYRWRNEAWEVLADQQLGFEPRLSGSFLPGR